MSERRWVDEVWLDSFPYPYIFIQFILTGKLGTVAL